MTFHQEMEAKGYRYVAPPIPPLYTDLKEYYATHKGEYIKNELGKDGKWILPDRFQPADPYQENYDCQCD